MQINKISGVLIGMLAANTVFAGNMGEMPLSYDSKIRANIIVFDANQIYLKDSVTTTSSIVASGASTSSTRSSENFTTGFSNTPFFVDGLMLDYEKDMSRLFSLTSDIRSMVGIRVLGKLGNTNTGVGQVYPAYTTILNGTVFAISPGEAISIRPWGLMGARCH